jgi:hypothetical protein
LILARGVRLRTTFALVDTSIPTARACLATCEHYAHVLAQYVDADFLTALEVGCGRRAGGASSAAVVAYKEVQVHGPLELARHVEALVGARAMRRCTMRVVCDDAFSLCINRPLTYCSACVLAVAARHADDADVRAQAEQFAERFGCNVLWTDSAIADSPAPAARTRAAAS